MPLSGKRVLITENEFLLALSLGQVLEEEGYAVAGPATSVEEALQLIEKSRPSGAILDINLNGEMVYPAAKELTDRSIPFLFITGYSALHIPIAFRNVPRLDKPVSAPMLVGTLKKMLSSAHPGPLH